VKHETLLTPFSREFREASKTFNNLRRLSASIFERIHINSSLRIQKKQTAGIEIWEHYALKNLMSEFMKTVGELNVNKGKL